MRARTYTGVEAHFSAAHQANGNQVHGHTWRVCAYWEWTGGDALQLQRILREVCAGLDHRMLPPELSLGEQLAEHIGLAVNACRCDVWRDAEGLKAIWER